MKQQTSHTRRNRARAMRRRRATRVIAWCLATLMVAAWLWAPQASGAEVDDTPFVEGDLPVPSGFTVEQLAVDSPAGLVFEIGSIAGIDGQYVQVVSATRRQLVGSPVALTVRGAPASVLSSNVVVDEARHRLFLPVRWANSGGFPVSGVLVFDGARRVVTNAEAPFIPYVQGSALQIDVAAQASLSYDAESDRLFVLGFPTAAPGANGAAANGTSPVATAAAVVQIDPSSGSAESYIVAGCVQLPTSLGGVPIVWDDALWIFCGGNALLNASAPNLTQGAFRIQLADGQFPQAGTGTTVYPVAGYYGGFGFSSDVGARIVGDRAGGRILVVAPYPGPAQIFVFDLSTRRVVGLMGIDPAAIPQRGCVDGSGRLYMYTGTSRPSPGSQLYGFLRGEARATSSPYPQVAGYPDFLSGYGTFRFACDWVRRQVLVAAVPNTGNSEQVVLVVRDPKPPYEPPPLPLDPDAATTGGPYDPATSGLAYQGDGRGFGAQVRLVGGYDPLVGTVVQGATLSYVQLGPVGSVGSIISPNSPKLTLGAAGLPDSPQGVALSDSQMTSAAQGIARDGGLEADMGRAGPALSQGGASGSGEGDNAQSNATDPWPYPVVTCAASPGDKSMTTKNTGANVMCDPEKYVAAASADTSDPVEIPGLVRIVGAGSSVISEVDKKTGVLTTTTKSWAKAVSLADGEIEIDNAVSEAVAQAGGQPGSAMATYRRTVGQLLINGQVICTPCDPAQVANAINAHPLTTPTVRASVPMPAGAPEGSDSQLYEIPGTPGGAQAEVARAADLQLEDQAVNEQSPYDREVSALRLEVENDGLRHLNVVIDLAAPQAFSRLQILGADAAVGEETTTTTQPEEVAPTTLPPAPPEAQPAAAAEVVPEPAGPPPAAPGFSTALVSYTPTAPPSVPEVMTSEPNFEAAPPQPVLPGPLGRVESGLRAAFASPSKFLALFLIWSVMAIPVYLASRRRLVLDFILGAPEGLS